MTKGVNPGIDRCEMSEIVPHVSSKRNRLEKCQSGLNVVVHTRLQLPFPYNVTVRFDPPLKYTFF